MIKLWQKEAQKQIRNLKEIKNQSKLANRTIIKCT